jgi:CHAT domain-containing protein/Tfp pilus assembly protein PilF
METAPFIDLVNRAIEQEASGDVNAALVTAREAEQAEHDPGDSLETLGAWNNLGALFFRNGYSDAAAHAYRIVAAGRAAADNIDLQSTLENNLGQALHRLGKLDEAKSHLSRSVEIRERTHPDSTHLAIALDNLGAVEHARGDLDTAETLYQRAVNLFTKKAGHFSVDVATAIGNLGGLYRDKHDAARAEAFSLRAFYTHLRADGPGGSGALLNAQQLCTLYLTLGRNEEVDWLVNLLLSLGESKARPGDRNLAGSLLELAKSAFVMHRLDISERALSRAVELFTATEGEEAPATLGARFQRATTYRALGRLADAESELTALLEAYGRGGSRLDVVRTTIELAKTVRDRGGKQPARELLDSAIVQLRSGDPENAEQLSSALGNLADLAYKENRNKEARAHYRAALDALEDRQQLDWPWLTHGLAMVEYHLGHHEDAARLYGKAKSRWVQLHGENHPFVATCAANLALVYWSTGQLDEALTAFIEATSLRDYQFHRELTLGSEQQRLEYAAQQQADLSKILSFCVANADTMQGTAEFAAQTTIRRKARVLDSLVHTLRQVRGALSDEVRGMMDQLLVVRGEIARVSGPLGAKAAVPGLVERLTAEEAALETALSHQGALREAGLEDITLTAVQSKIPEDSALIEYVRYRRFVPARDGATPWREVRYAAVLLTRHDAPRWFDLGDAADIDLQANELRDAISNPATDYATLVEASRQLFASLVEPMQESAEKCKHWLIAPDGLINLVPFDVLLDTWQGLENSPLVSYLVTARDLIPADETIPGSDICVLAAPDFDAAVTEETTRTAGALKRGERFVPLPGTLKEAQGIQQTFPQARLFDGANATADALTQMQSTPLILHVATHGVFEPLGAPETTWSTDLVPLFDQVVFFSRPHEAQIDPMLYSGLVFAGANNADALRGVATAREIAGIDLHGTELVVLSACDTGVGHIADGQEFSGLRRAFGIAGARSQLTSLWSVFDDSTAALMLAFYQAIQAGSPRVKALRDAQLAVKSSPEHPEWAHPECWAAFGLSGAWGPVAGVSRSR